jgi:hypothetical protein
MPKGLTKVQNNLVVEAEALFDEVRTDPDFAQKMAKRGYDEATWDKGRQLLADLLDQGRARAQAESANITPPASFTICVIAVGTTSCPWSKTVKPYFKAGPTCSIS